MGFGRRLYDILRAQVGHYTREATGRLGGTPWSDGDPGRDEGGAPEDRADDLRRGGAKRDEIAAAYRLLELPYGGGPEEVRSAHRSLMRRYHPDRFARDEEGLADATRLSQEITAARDLLLSALERGCVR